MPQISELSDLSQILQGTVHQSLLHQANQIQLLCQQIDQTIEITRGVIK